MDPLHEALQSAYECAALAITDFLRRPDHIALTATLASAFASAFQTGNKILICGNGGSACDAMHFAEELTGRYRQTRKALPALALSDPSFLTCVANDFGFEQVFARGVEAYAKPGDWLIVLSTSGNSPNILNAVRAAESLGVQTLALLGKDGGQLKGRCTHEFIVPQTTSDRIQEIHMVILHILVEGIERVLFPQHYPVADAVPVA